MLVPLTSFAQNDAFFMTENDVFFRDASWSFTVNTQGFGETPLGSGLLILTAVGAGYVISKRRRNRKNISKGTALLLAGLMLIGTTGCRKKIVEPIANVSDEIFITVKVNGGPRADITAAGTIVFEDGDKIYVGNKGLYIGTLTYHDGAFSGTVYGPSTEDYLHFYFLGNLATVDITEGSTTSFTVNIADQSSSLPVLSYGHSSTKYIDGNTTYGCTLLNQCALAEFKLNYGNSGAVKVTDMPTVATISFANPDNAIAATGTKGV